MTAVGLVSLRRDRVRNAVCRIAADVKAWLDGWKEPGLQTSQIERSGAVLRGMVARLDAQIADLPTDERALAATRGLEWDLSIVEGLFRLLADRFDQRRDPALAPTLKAADELIWSCMQQTRLLFVEPLPLPLAYIDPAFSPSATPRIKPPPTLPARDRVLAEMLRVLPVPLIGLPSGIVEEPWWLVLIAHEVGHHVQYDAGSEAVQRTGAVLKEVAGTAWEGWRQEVFADLFSVLALGPIAIDAAAALEWDLPESMAAGKSLYPPVIVRLALMAECAAAAGFSDVPPYGAAGWADTLAQVSAERREAVLAQLSRVEDVVAAVLDLRIGRGSLRRLADGAPPGRPGPDPIAAALQRRLRGEDVVIRPGRDRPRSAAREAFRAYRDLAAEADPERRTDAQRRLRERAIALIAEVGDGAPVKRPPRDPASTAAIVDRMFEVLREVEAA